jgi:transposase InsO family protein
VNSHKHARLTPKGRALLVERVLDDGWSVQEASLAAGVSRRTTYKWIRRFEAEGEDGLFDRSSRPHSSPTATSPRKRRRFEQLRRRRWPLWRIASDQGSSIATVSRCMKRVGLSRLKSLEPVEPVVRYERELPGELIHIDTKRLGKINGIGHRITGIRMHAKAHHGQGWDAVHLAIDDHSRVAFARIKVDETKESCVEFLREALAFYVSLGVRVEGVMTDNGSGYKKTYDLACAELGVRHLRTKPYTPKTNGKVERFVQTSLREWAYLRPYRSSALREAALQPFIHHYNWHRPHSALAHQPPMIRIPAVNDLMKLNT